MKISFPFWWIYREPHIKYNPIGKVDPHLKYGMEIGKPNEPLKFEHSSKYSSMAADLSQKYETKPFADQPLPLPIPIPSKFMHENSEKPIPESAHNEPIKSVYSTEANDNKFQPHSLEMKYPENMTMKRPSYSEPGNY